jgi:hypothetical protein
VYYTKDVNKWWWNKAKGNEVVHITLEKYSVNLKWATNARKMYTTTFFQIIRCTIVLVGK